MRTSLETLRVLHDPLSYYRPWRQSAATLAPHQRSSLNAWLSQRYDLPGYNEPLPEQRQLSQRLLQGWSRLPAVAYLMACAKLRRRLMGARDFLSRPAQVHMFLRLGFEECPLAAPAMLDDEALLGWGAAYLCEGLAGHWADWLHARLPLCFVGLPVPSLALQRNTVDFDMTCFWSAWNYAAKDAGLTAAVRC
jgi:type III secretion system OrgA/MxiK family protein